MRCKNGKIKYAICNETDKLGERLSFSQLKHKDIVPMKLTRQKLANVVQRHQPSVSEDAIAEIAAFKLLNHWHQQGAAHLSVVLNVIMNNKICLF